MEAKQTEQMLLEAIRSVAGEKAAQPCALTVEEVRVLLGMADQQKLLPVAVEALHGCDAAENAPDYPAFKRAARAQVTQQARRGLAFLEIYEKLKEAGVPALVVKGSVCRAVWQKGHLRISADEDLYVPPAEFRTACKVLRENGLTCADNADPEADFEIGWRKPNSTLYIELHQKLFAPESGATGDLQRYFDDAFDRAREYAVEQGAGTVLSMSPEDHLLYLLLHAYKHFIHSGFGIRQVCDVGLWTKRYADEIDHARLLRRLQEAHALHFAAAVFAIAKEDMGIDPQLPACWDTIKVDREPMRNDLLDGGVYGASSMSRQHAAPMTLEAVAASRGNRKKKGLLRRAFPPKDALLRDYPELKAHPTRLPLVWVKRLMKYRNETKNDETNSASESIRIAKEREALLRLYRII